MNRLKRLIHEVLSTPPKQDKCNCGCHDCDNVGNPGVVINESLGAPIIMTENLRYHVENKLPLTENTFRYGSTAFLDLWAEARYLYAREAIHVNDLDKEILTETNLGEYGMFEGKRVPLDMPMVYENPYQPILEDIQVYGKIYESVNIDNSYKLDDVKSNEVGNEFIFTDKHGIKRKLLFLLGNSVKLLWFNPSTQEWTTDDIPSKYEDNKVMNTFGMILVKVILPKYGSFNLQALNEARYRLFRALIYNGLDISQYEMDYDDDARTIEVYKIDTLTEEEKYRPDERAPYDYEEEHGYIIKNTGVGGRKEQWTTYLNPKTNELSALHRTYREPERPTVYAPDETKPGDDEILDGFTSYDGERWAVYYDPKTKTYNARHRANSELFEAKKKKKDPPIGKPKRGGSKKFYVYVRNPKTKKIKKVSFGDTTGLSVKINDSKARQAFAKRHKCAQATDRTKARYWSCRIGRYWKQLGGSKNFSGFW